MPASEEFRRQAALLVRVIPLVAKETRFALKGGTAINLFVRDMPRLSVDIDTEHHLEARGRQPQAQPAGPTEQVSREGTVDPRNER